MRKRTIAISLSVLAVAALAGGAYAAGGSGSPPPAKPFSISEQTLIKDAANHLGVSPAKLTGAFKQALIDQINAQHLPAAQTKAIKKAIAHGPGLPPFGLGLFGPRGFGPGMIHAQVVAPGMVHAQITAAPPFFLLPAVLPAAAKYLGLSDQQLVEQLRSGKTLAQIARERGKSATGLEQAIVTGARSALQKSLAAGRAAEQHLLGGLTKQVQKLINSKGPIWPLPPSGSFRKGAPGGAAFFGMLPPPIVRAYLAPKAVAAPAP